MRESSPARSRPWRDRPILFAVGALLAAALFLVESGLAEVLLAGDARCLEANRALRVGPAEGSTCLSMEARAFVHGLSGMGIPRAGSAPGSGRWGTLGVYAALGGLCSLTGRRGVIIFLGVHALILAGTSVLAYLANFVVPTG